MKMRQRFARCSRQLARCQGGFGAIAAIVVVVMLSSLAAAVVRLSWTQQTSFAQDIMGAKAFQAANAGAEWGMYQALKGSWTNANCTGSTTLDLRATIGFLVTITCTTQASAYVEGQDATGANIALRVYQIDAVACNGSAASCPDNTSSANVSYVERSRRSIISSMNNGY